MLNSTVSFTIYFFEMLISYVVFTYVSERKHSVPVTLLIGSILFGSGAIINLVCDNNVWLNSFYTVSSTFIFAVVCFQIKFKSAGVYTLLMSVFSVTFEFATIFAVSALFGTKTTEYNSNAALLFIEVGISKTLYLLACISLIYAMHGNKSMDKIPSSFFIYPLGTLLSMISFWYICYKEALGDVAQLLLSIVSIILLGSTLALFIIYKHNLERESEYVRVKSEFDRIQTEKAYYDILEHQNQQLMIYAHDAKKHMTAIRNLNTDPRIGEYIEKLNSQLVSYTSNCHSGNMTLDVIINKYVTECEIYGIKFEYDVRPCNLSIVEDIDLVSILGNLMDNALTAAKKSAQKSLSIATTWRNSYNVVIICNSCDERPMSIGTQLISTKEDHKIHGFGLKSVRNTLKKYRGDFDWEYNETNHEFITTVLIKHSAD